MKKIIPLFVILLLTLCAVSAYAAPGGPSMTPPDDYDYGADSYRNIRETIGYGDIENDPNAHGLTVYGSPVSSTPELGDSSAPVAALLGVGMMALAGVVVADKKRRSLSH